MRAIIASGAVLIGGMTGMGPADASAASVDLEIVSITASRSMVPVGVPTAVTYVVRVRNNGAATTGSSASIGPQGPSETNTNVALHAQNSGSYGELPATCDTPGGDKPRCRVGFLQRPQTQDIEVTDTVLASSAGPVKRSFVADVLVSDVDIDRSNDRADSVIQAVPGALPTLSGVVVRPVQALSDEQRRRAVGQLVFLLDRDAVITVMVDRRRRSRRYVRWGGLERTSIAGRNSMLLPNLIDYRSESPINAALRPMAPGTYRLKIVANDGHHDSRTITRTLVVRGRR